jgi:hypothetical protein
VRQRSPAFSLGDLMHMWQLTLDRLTAEEFQHNEARELLEAFMRASR